MEVTDFEGEQPKDYRFELYEDRERQQMILTSPMSGPYRYKYDQKAKLWISLNNAHFLEGLLVKEMMQITNGYLKF